MRKPKLRIYHDGQMDTASEMAIGAPEGMGAPKELVVMLSTDVIDSNGIEIYEGDIVERECGDKKCEDRHVGIVEYDSLGGSYVIANPKQGKAWPMVSEILASDGRRVVGRVKPKVLDNGYENPKLYTLL